MLGVQFIGRLLAPVAGRAIPGWLGRLTLGWRVARTVSGVGKEKGWQVSRRKLRRALSTRQAITELLQSDSQTYPSLVSVAKKSLIRPHTLEAVSEVALAIAEAFIAALPDRASIQVHTSREAANIRADIRDLQAEGRIKNTRAVNVGDADTLGDDATSNLHLIPRSMDLIDRANIESRAADVLERERLLVLVGPHGSGKSALAGQLALSSHARVRWWINGHSDEALLLGVETLLVTLGKSTGGSKIDEFRRILVEQDDALVILDGVDDARRLQPLMPAGLRAQVIVTTTDPLAAPNASEVSVGPLSTPQSVELFERLVAVPLAGTRQNVEDLVDALSGLPLAIRQAAAYVRASSISPAQLSERLAQSSRRVLGEHAPNDYPHPLVTVHDLVRATAIWEEPRAEAVLALVAMSGPGGLTHQLLGVASSTLDVDRALSVLARTGLVQVSYERATCHSITARLELEPSRPKYRWFSPRRWLGMDVTQPRGRRYLPLRAIPYALSLGERGDLEHPEVALPAVTALFPHAGFNSRYALLYRTAALDLALRTRHPQTVVAHAGAIRSLVEGKRKYRSTLLKTLLIESEQLLELGMPGRSLPLATQAIDLAEELGDRDSYAGALSRASQSNLQLGNREIAIELAERAAAAGEDVASLAERRAVAARLKATLDNPVTQMAAQLSIRDTLPTGSAEWALQTTYAGRSFVEAGHPARGLELSTQALAADVRLFGEESLPAARDANDIGFAYVALGDFVLAEQWLRRSLAIYEGMGELHSHAGVPLLHLGRLYHQRALGAADEAERETLRAKAEELLGKSLALNLAEGAHSSELAGSLVALGDTMLLSPDPDGRANALEHYERALEIDRRQFAEDHSEVIIDTLRVVGAHLVAGSLKEAKSVIESLAKILSRSHDLPVQQAQALQMRIFIETFGADGSPILQQQLSRQLVRLERQNQETPVVARDIAQIIDGLPINLRAIADAADYT